MRLERYEQQQDDLQDRADYRETALAQLADAEREIDQWHDALDEYDAITANGTRLA